MPEGLGTHWRRFGLLEAFAIVHEDLTMNAILDKFVSRPEFCRQLGITVRTAELWAHGRRGPCVTIIGRRAYYHVDDIGKYLAACRNGKKQARGTRRAP